MTGEQLYCDPELAQFYDWDNTELRGLDCFAQLASGADRILDLGCGTGVFSVAFASRGHRVTGIDPAGAMLEIARERPGGDRVRWIRSDARGLDLKERFDAVLMTGHAFQAFLTREDRAALMETIARHVDSGGRFFFDSRNPEARAWERWTPESTRETLPHPEFGKVERWNDATKDQQSGLVTYGTYYRAESGRLISAQSSIAFAPQSEIAELIAEAGLSVHRWIGDYSGSSFTSESPEIIPLGSRAG